MVLFGRISLKKLLVLALILLNIFMFLLVRLRLNQGHEDAVSAVQDGSSRSPGPPSRRHVISVSKVKGYERSVNVSVDSVWYRRSLATSDKWVSVDFDSSVWLWKAGYLCNRYCKPKREIVVFGLKQSGHVAVGQYAFVRYKAANECVPLHSSAIARASSLGSRIFSKNGDGELQLEPHLWTGLLQRSSGIPLSITFTARQKCRQPLWNTETLVHHIDQNPLQDLKAIGICNPDVLQLNASLQEARKIIEWIEMNKLLGVEHFTLYVAGWQQLRHEYPDVAKVLKQYVREDMLKIVKWGNEKGNNLMRAVECLYRNYDKVSRVIVASVNELVVPRRHSNLHQMISSLKLNRCRVIRFFTTQWFRSEMDSPRNVSSNSYCSSEQIPYFLEQTTRYQHPSKDKRTWAILVEPLCLSNAVQLIAQFFNDKEVYLVPSHIATRHEYRQTDPLASSQTLQDPVMNSYQSTVIEAVKNRLCPSSVTN